MHFQSTDSRQSDEGKDDASLAGAVDLKALLRKGLDSDDSGGGPKPRGDAHSQGSPPMALVARSSRDLGTNPDDDAASDGGQSAMSAQSDDGADYKRGKRYRKLIKLMDSGQTQQTKRGGMVALGRSGQMQRYVHEERMKGVLDAHHNPTSTIADLLFASKRQVLDALLYIAVNNAIWVDTIQILFLATEGVAISCVAAW
ncbi:hypothetical protein PLESTF_000796200 [Pleodorina starrii]|nr:hypothetical protein PLESTF_000796200 [Pleodorina starrii]